MSFLIDAIAHGTATEDDIRSLLESGVDINARTGCNDCSRTALMYAAQYSKSLGERDARSRTSNRKNIMKMLLDAGADVNQRADRGNTALIHAARFTKGSSTEDTVRILLDAGADVNAIGPYGMSALNYATYYYEITSTKNTVKLLLEADADITVVSGMELTALSALFTIYANELNAMCTLTLLIENTF